MSTADRASRAAEQLSLLVAEAQALEREETIGHYMAEYERNKKRISTLEALLRESKREHQWDEDDKCDKLNKINSAEKICTCGADAWNARVDEALK